MGTITWLTRTMDQQQIMGTTLVQQACELLCALSDVVFVVVSVAPDASGMALQATSSSRSGARGYTASAFMRLDCAGGSIRKRAMPGKGSAAVLVCSCSQSM
jgi:hypothetical protein